MTAKIGVVVPQGWRLDLRPIEDPVDQFEAISRFAVEAELLGYDSVWLFDHFHTILSSALETTFERWGSTAALTRDTSTIGSRAVDRSGRLGLASRGAASRARPYLASPPGRAGQAPMVPPCPHASR